MLKSIVEQKHINTSLTLQLGSRSISIRPHSESNAISQPPSQQLNLVARPARSLISAAQNRHALPFRQKFLRQPQHHRRLARPAGRQISDADNCPLQSLRFQPSRVIHPILRAHHPSIHNRHGPQRHRQPPRNPRHAGRPKYFAISSIARAVAPRLSSTSLFAVSLIPRARSGSRSNSIHATPASSGLSTCTAALADTNRDAISAKFSIDGPNTG